MVTKEIFRLTPMKPEQKNEIVEAYLYSFGGYTCPDKECRFSTQYMHDKLTIRQNRNFQITDPLGNFWENGTIRIQLKKLKLTKVQKLKIALKVKTKDEQIIQIFFGIQKLREQQISGSKTISLIIEPNKGDTNLHIRLIKSGSLLHFFSVVGYLIEDK